MSTYLRLTLALCLALAAVSATTAGDTDGTVIGASKIVDNGPAADRFNLVLVAEGYTEAELTTFAERAQEFADFLFATPPFSSNCSAINVWRLDVASTEAGADDPIECEPGTGAAPATYFDATFCADGTIRRLLGVDNLLAINTLDTQVPEWDQALVIVNSGIYGGDGGSIGTASLAGPWKNVAVHEFGHAAFGLADEYDYWQGCGIDTDRDMHPAVEPVQPNVTTETDRALVKWASLIDADTPVPTTENPDCTNCDGQPDPTDGAVGLFEGAHYYHCDAFRPVHACMMRNFGEFCPVCTARILAVLEPFQPENTAPECDAGGPYTEECEGEITDVKLDGSDSSDVDCDELGFAWSGDFVEETAEGMMTVVNFVGLGTFPVDLEVSDADATSACDTVVLVEDTLAPNLELPLDALAECESPDGTPVDIGEAIVLDICDSDPVVVNDALELYPLGDTIVTWTATDESENSSSGEQTVTVQDTTLPLIDAPENIVTECTSPLGTPVELGEPVVFDVCDDDPEVANDAPDLFPLGETIVLWSATDDSGNIGTDPQSVTIVDTTAPELSVSVSPTELWPPNHKMKTITATIEVSDICDAVVDVTLVSIVSDEPDNGQGDGNTVNDIRHADFGTDDREFDLRAERAGGGDGRTYTITYRADDDSDNSTERVVTVFVPHDRGGNTGGAIDTDGPDEVF